MKAKIFLYCEGRIDNDFVFCNGVENVVINLQELIAHSNYLDLIEYMDKIAKIFDAPCCNLNIISSAIYKFHDWGYIDEEKYKRLIDFCKFHNRCGLILYAIPSEV